MDKQKKNEEEIIEENTDNFIGTNNVEKKDSAECENCKTKEKEIQELQKINENLQKKNTHLTQIVEQFNQEYKTKLENKMKEANEMLKEKQNELSAKFNDELNEAKKYAIEKQASKLIDVTNQFDMALSFTPKDEKLKNYQMGFKMFLDMLKGALENMGIKEIPINIGDEFNPIIMEAVDYIETNDIKSNCVAQIINKGYKLHDRVIRTAVVNLAK